MSRFHADDDTEFIELNEWEQELTFFHTLIKVNADIYAPKFINNCF